MSKINDTMDTLKKRATEALETYAGKENWKAEDLEGAKNAVKLYNEICDAMMKDGIWEDMKGDWGNSGYRSPHGYTRISYGMDPMIPPNNSYNNGGGNNSYNSYNNGGNSGYGNHNNSGYRNDMRYDPRYDDGNSTHSIKDRMIAALERQMDEARTEYEKEEVRKAIQDIERLRR